MNTKEKVIEALEKAKGNYISGEELAKSCGVSRNAVWKSITELRKNGYSIKSANNRGYMLEETSDIVSKAGICMYLDRALEGKTKKKDLADRIFVYEELDSTNSEAKRGLLFANDHVIHGTAIIARRQTAGRGHEGSRFSSPDGGIYLSVILEPGKVGSKKIPVTDLAADSVRSVLERLSGTKIERRQNSSLYWGEEKVCGIMTEGIADLETGIYSNYIVGIGIRTDRLPDPQGRSPEKNEMIAEIIKELVF